MDRRCRNDHSPYRPLTLVAVLLVGRNQYETTRRGRWVRVPLTIQALLQMAVLQRAEPLASASSSVSFCLQ